MLGVALPAYTEARLASIDLTQIQPAEHRADVVVLLLFNGDAPVRVIIVEVQLEKKDRKRFTWPAYVTVSRAVHGCSADGLDDDRARFYYDLVYNSLNEAARRALEAMMKGYEYQSEFAKKYVAQGHKEGECALLLRLLRARFGELPASAITRIEGAETASLERWGERVLSAKTLAEVLEEPS